MRKGLVEKEGCALSVRRQCELLGVNRNRLAVNESGGLSERDQAMAREIDEVYLRFPEFGARRMSEWLRRKGWESATRRRVSRLMRAMGIEAVYCRPQTSKPASGVQIYPYLLRNRVVQAPDEVWCTDITYIPMSRGFAYLVAIMDWRSRAVLAWKLSNTLEGSFCQEALREALWRGGIAPEIFNTDQGCQFTAEPWISTLIEAGIRVSMDGKGRWMDNVFIERLWRSVKHEGVYLWAYEDLHDLERALGRWFSDYNHLKPHQALDYRTPWEVYRPEQTPAWKQAA